MTEIRVNVDLAHPPERVWRAFTEARIVVGWLPTARFVVTEDNRFTFRATDLPGLDEQVEGQVVTSDGPHRLVMRWEAPNLHTLLSLTLLPTPNGCQLSVAQRGFLGPQGTMRRRVLQRTYTELLEGPLVLSLERLAVEEAQEAAAQSRPDPAKVELGRRNDGRAFQRLPRQVDGRTTTPPRSASAPGLSSHVRAAAGPRHAVAMPGFAAAVLGAQAAAQAGANPARPVGVVRVEELAKLGHRPVRRWVGRLVRSVGGFVRAGRSRIGNYWSRVRIGRSWAVAGWSWVGAAWSRARSVSDWPPERRRQAVAAVAALLLLLAMVALLVGRSTAPRPTRPPQVGGGGQDPIQAAVPGQPPEKNAQRRSAAPASAVPSIAPASGRPSVSSRVEPAGIALSAAYKTESTRVSGYNATITITNSTGRAVQDWTVTLTLPLLDLRVHDVEGADSFEHGKELTLTPVDATRSVGAGSAVRLRFQVDGLGRPTTCAIDGQPCTGIPE